MVHANFLVDSPITMAQDTSFKNVADTALWVATYRDDESKRPDALFHDRQAACLPEIEAAALPRPCRTPR